MSTHKAAPLSLGRSPDTHLQLHKSLSEQHMRPGLGSDGTAGSFAIFFFALSFQAGQGY